MTTTEQALIDEAATRINIFLQLGHAAAYGTDKNIHQQREAEDRDWRTLGVECLRLLGEKAAAGPKAPTALKPAALDAVEHKYFAPLSDAVPAPAETITRHEGSKYLRKITAAGGGASVMVDVYAVLVAFGVACPARQHAVKKLLCAGQRGKGDQVADLVGVRAAVNRAIELAGAG